MTMVKMFTANKLYEVSGKGFDPTHGGVSLNGQDSKNDPAVRSTLLSAALCCNPRLAKEYDESLKEEFWRPKGNSSEAPIVVAAAKVGFWESELGKQYPRSLEVPFSSSRKMMMTVSKIEGSSTLGDGGVNLQAGTKLLAVVKGAPNYIIDQCTTYLTPEGTEAPMTEAVKASTELHHRPVHHIPHAGGHRGTHDGGGEGKHRTTSSTSAPHTSRRRAQRHP